MPKRRTSNSSAYGADDNPIGLTGAFAPVRGAQSVDYDDETGDDPVGLTQAFGAVSGDGREPTWNASDKWKGFDWDSVPNEFADDLEDAGEAPDAGGASVQEAGQEVGSEAPRAAAATAPAASVGAAAAVGAPASAATVPSATRTTAGAKPGGSGGSGRGRHAAPVKELSPRMKKSRRTRRILIALLVILLLVIGAVGFFWYRTWTGSHQEAAQQTQEQMAAPNQREGIADAPARDAAESTAKLADVPNLAAVIGKTQDEALADIGRGALITANSEVNEEDNPIKTNLNVALTEEPADSKTGTPTVYLGLDEGGIVRQAGYSAAASALGFGSLSFADAVNNEHVVEKTLAKIGVPVQEGSAVLPANKDEYSTYASDGTTVIRERCSFEGDTSVGETPCTWSAVLSYDYTTQVVTGNLNDTVRIIYAYITAS